MQAAAVIIKGRMTELNTWPDRPAEPMILHGIFSHPGDGEPSEGVILY
jgi:hypothetical protein